MTMSSISAVGLSQDVLSSGASSQQRALQSLQNNLASGDLNGAQSAFQTLQTVLQNAATASGAGLSSNSQLSTDVASLGSALSSGDLSTARSQRPAKFVLAGADQRSQHRSTFCTIA